MTELCTIDLLIIDDFALEPMSREEEPAMSTNSSSSRNARASTIVTSNRDTADWLGVFDDALLGQGMIDRFKNNAYGFVVEGESYRETRSSPTSTDDEPSACGSGDQTSCRASSSDPTRLVVC